MTFRQNASGVCFRIYAFDLFVHHVCGSYCGVCFVLVWEHLYISLAYLGKCIMGYEYFIHSIGMCLDFSM
jgi:hypothetical protein